MINKRTQQQKSLRVTWLKMNNFYHSIFVNMKFQISNVSVRFLDMYNILL